MHTLFPLWIRHYPRQHLRDDLIAGIVLTILVIPQSLGYALLAGLPAQAGLYASVLPALAYALWGSSMVQVVGPVAITAIMTLSVLSPLATPGSALYIQLAALLSLSSGALIALCGLARLGFLSQLLSRPVVSGFVSGSAILIVLSQMRFILGLHDMPSLGWNTLQEFAELGQHTQPASLLIGITALAALGLARKGLHNWPLAQRVAPLLVLGLATLAVGVLDWDTRYGVAVVGPVSATHLGTSLHWPGFAQMQVLLGPSLLIALIGMVQSITMAQALAAPRRERIDSNRELIGLGAANLAAAWMGGMPVGGGMSRSAINVSAGAQTPLAGLVSAACMSLVLLVGTAWLEKLPLAALAASIMVAAMGMVNLTTIRQTWTYDKADGMALLGTALGVLLLGLQWGIALGIGLSLASLLWRSSTPHIAVVGRLAGTHSFRNVERYTTETLPHALFLRIDESLFFGNLQAVENRLNQELSKAGSVTDVVLIMTAVNRIDASALQALTDINHELHQHKIALHLAEVKGPVQDRLVHTALWKQLCGQVFPSVAHAYQDLAARQQPAQDPALAI